MYFLLFRNYLPLKKRAGSFIWTNSNPLHPKLPCAQFGLNWPSGSGEEDFLKFFQCIFAISLYLPLKKTGPFIWTNSNPLHPKMLCAKFGLIWPSGSGEEDLFNFVYVFLLFHNYLPKEKSEPFIWTNLNSHHPKIRLVEIDQVVLE